MSNIVNHNDHHDSHDHQGGLNNFGFWLYLMTDCMLFGALFAVFLVLKLNVSVPEFDLGFVFLETIILLTSSFTFGLAMIGIKKHNKNMALIFIAITFLLGLWFIYLELTEFMELIHEGRGPSSHAYYSAFFALVGTHGLHVTAGLIWMIALFIQLLKRGVEPIISRKLSLLSLFWHFLDIIWIFVFSIVYLLGAL
jgi:cytochrome o ubiquinol oxidase subunit 3